MGETNTPPVREGHHAGFGCAIFVVAAVVFLGIVAWSLYTLKEQDKIIGHLTTDEETKTRLPEGSPESLAGLGGRLSSFSQACLAEKPATLTLGETDLNLLLLHFPELGPYHGLVYFTSIAEDGRIGADFALPLNQMQFWKGPRYLVGKGHLKLSFQPEEFRLYLILDDLAVDGEPVPQGFLFNFEHWLWLTPYYDDEEKKKVLLRITGLEFEEGA